MKHISIIAIPRALGSSITIPLEMLTAANDLAKAKRKLDSIIKIELIGVDDPSPSLVGDLNIHCHRLIGEVASTDLIFVPGVWRKPMQAAKDNQQLIAWIGRQYRTGATVCAATTGAYFLAQAGLLDDKPATTHWRYFRDFSRNFPQIKLQRKRFTTSADRAYCTGSVNAIRDIMLHFIAKLYGSAIANEVAQHFTHELKPSFESEILGKDQHNTHHDEVIIAIQEWLQNNFQDDIQFSTVADKFGLSVRSLNRRFKLATNTTPLQYLQSLRLVHAKSLLKHSNLVIAEVADTVGYQDCSYFTELFKKTNSMTPNQYRELVRNKMFSAESKQPDP